MTSRIMPGKLPVAEILLIIFSVFIAVALESWWDEHNRAADARIVLAQTLDELIRDRNDLSEIIVEQNARDGQYLDLDRWLALYGSMPLDSVGDALDSLAWSNRTLWPRGAGWKTMVAANQLGLLRSPDLVAALGNHYENLNVRLLSNSLSYGASVNRFVLETVPIHWDAQNHVLLSNSATAVAALRTELHLLHYSWNQWYRSYLLQYSESLDSVIAMLQSYLALHD